MMNPLTIFHEQGDVVEIRIIDGNNTIAGYFKDLDLAYNEAMKYDGKHNIYFMFNKLNEGCYHRCPDALKPKAKTTANDNDVVQRRWVLIDYDPIRPREISSTDDEKKKAHEKMLIVGKFLKGKGFKYPVLADSGNGYHSLYRVDLSNNTETRDLISRFLQALDMLFSDEIIQIDVAVFNAARITKLYGTKAVKGANTDERPHRASQIMFVPDKIEVNSINSITKIADMLPKPEVNKYTGGADFDIDTWVRKHLLVRRVAEWTNNTKYVLDECPFDAGHGKDAAVIRLASGAVAFHCFHNGCANRTWKDLRQKFEPGCYDKEYREYTSDRKMERKKEKPAEVAMPVVSENIDDETKAILEKATSVKDIQPLDRANVEIFSMGLPLLDENVEVLFGKLALVTGVNGSGKSTWFSQIMIEALQQEYNVFAYSGELKADEFQYWTDLQAAGSDNLIKDISKKGKTYYRIKPDAANKIHEWYDGKFWLYDNNQSMKYEDILKTIEAYRRHKNCRVIFIDNFMTLDITELDDQDLKAQTKFIWSLARYVKLNNVLVFLVIHPKKIFEGICQKQDVLGTGNFSNAIDYMFIVHRVNEAYKTHLAKRVMPKTIKAYIEDADNIIEIGKDRWSGREGLNIALKFYEDSKRLVDIYHAEDQFREYGWVKSEQGDAWEDKK